MTKAFPQISMIAAIAGPKRTLGNKGQLIVAIGDDLKLRFRALTMGHAIIMGRKTFESIGKALPGRQNFVITRNADLKVEGVIVCASFDEAIEKATEWELANPIERKEIFIVGGGEIYTQALPRANKLYLTLIDTDADGDVFFPDYSAFKTIMKREDRMDEKTGLKYSWIDLER